MWSFVHLAGLVGSRMFSIHRSSGVSSGTGACFWMGRPDRALLPRPLILHVNKQSPTLPSPSWPIAKHGGFVGVGVSVYELGFGLDTDHFQDVQSIGLPLGVAEIEKGPALAGSSPAGRREKVRSVPGLRSDLCRFNPFFLLVASIQWRSSVEPFSKVAHPTRALWLFLNGSR